MATHVRSTSPACRRKKTHKVGPDHTSKILQCRGKQAITAGLVPLDSIDIVHQYKPPSVLVRVDAVQPFADDLWRVNEAVYFLVNGTMTTPDERDRRHAEFRGVAATRRIDAGRAGRMQIFVETSVSCCFAS